MHSTVASQSRKAEPHHSALPHHCNPDKDASMSESGGKPCLRFRRLGIGDSIEAGGFGWIILGLCCLQKKRCCTLNLRRSVLEDFGACAAANSHRACVPFLPTQHPSILGCQWLETACPLSGPAIAKFTLFSAYPAAISWGPLPKTDTPSFSDRALFE